MNAERLLAHYEKIADARDAIARLRRFILDLAVRGKLVPQDASDEPALGLLKRIANEKARLAKAGEIKTPKAIPALTETPFPIPSNWRWSQLAEIGVLSPRNEAPDTLGASFVPMPLIAAEYGVANQHEVRPWCEIKKGYTHFAEGDVGLAKITPCFENGKSAVFRNLTGGIGAGTTELHVIRPLFVDQDYILLFLKSPHFIETGIPKMTGTAGQKRVPTEYFAHSPFPLPPLAEQRRIVAKVAELMGLCDRLEAARSGREAVRDGLAAASLARLNAPDPETFEADVRFALDALPACTARPDQIKALRQTILNLAVRGKLVPQDPNDEPAAELLKRIAVEKERLRLRLVPSAKLNFAEPPTGWAWTTIGSYATDVFTGPFGSMLHQSDYVKGGIPLINPSHMKSDRIEHDPMVSVAAATAKRMSSYTLTAGDIVMARRGEVGRAALVEPAQSGWLCGTGSFFLRFLDEVNRHFLLLVLRTSELRAYLAGNAVGTTMVNLNHGILKRAPLLVPPLAEQRRIVAKVDALMTLCDRLEASLTASTSTRRRLLDALLAEALAPVPDGQLEAAE